MMMMMIQAYSFGHSHIGLINYYGTSEVRKLGLKKVAVGP